MTLTEAIRTGLPFKRPSWTGWVETKSVALFHKEPRKHSYSERIDLKLLTKEDALATDFEISDPLKDTLENLKEALEKEYEHVRVIRGMYGLTVRAARKRNK